MKKITKVLSSLLVVSSISLGHALDLNSLASDEIMMHGSNNGIQETELISYQGEIQPVSPGRKIQNNLNKQEMVKRCTVDYLNDQIQVRRVQDDVNQSKQVYRINPYLTKECQALYDLYSPELRVVHNNNYNWYLEKDFINGLPPATWSILNVESIK